MFYNYTTDKDEDGDGGRVRDDDKDGLLLLFYLFIKIFQRSTPSAPAVKAALLYSNLRRQKTSRPVPSPLLPSSHHAQEEAHPLVLHSQVLAGPDVRVPHAADQMLLVLSHIELARLAPPPGGGVLVVARVVPGHPPRTTLYCTKALWT